MNVLDIFDELELELMFIMSLDDIYMIDIEIFDV